MNLPEPYNVLIPNQVAYLQQDLPPSKRKREEEKLEKLLERAKAENEAITSR